MIIILIKIKEIYFTGNTQIKEGKLHRLMKETKENCFCSKFIFFALAFAIRIGLIYVAHIVDTTSTTNKYTDTDYDVFSDAA